MTQAAGLTWTIEDALIAALLLPWMNHWEWVTELQQLQQSHFVWYRNWWIFRTMRQMQRDDEAINRPSVAFRMQQENPGDYDKLKVRDYILVVVGEFKGEPLTSPFVRQWAQDLMNLRSECAL
jgi:hypothetical protein